MGRFQDLLDRDGHVFFPGIYDAVTALLARQAGFKSIFVSGYAVAASRLGEPDVGLLTQTEMLDRVRNICRAVDIPVIADADTGYGNAVNVQRTVRDLIAAGAAGCFIEDQVWPKRCGHMQGKRVVDRQEFLGKMRAALDARGDDDFFICARTDAIAAVSLDEAIARGQAARDLGVDAVFVEAPGSRDDLARIVDEVGGTLVANMVEGGATPILQRDQLVEQGFTVVIYPVSALFSAASAVRDTFQALLRDGTTDAVASRMLGFDEFGELVGLPEKYALARRYGSDDD